MSNTDFDPNSYLAAAPPSPPQATGFNPDSYLSTPASSNRLGFYEGAMHPFDRAAVALSKTMGKIPYVGPAIERAGTALGMPGASEAEAAHQDYIAQQRKAGVVPGGAGEFAGEVAA